MQKCVDVLFDGLGILISSFKRAGKDTSGEIQFSWVEGESTPKETTITTNTTSYTTAQITENGRGKRKIELQPGEKSYGFTIGTQTINYAASDADKTFPWGFAGVSGAQGKFVSIQIHEFGHALGNLFKKQLKTQDIGGRGEIEETGQVFEGCVNGTLKTILDNKK